MEQPEQQEESAPDNLQWGARDCRLLAKALCFQFDNRRVMD